jgi:hypothetical protein
MHGGQRTSRTAGPEAEDVRARVGFVPGQLLRGHVLDRPQHRAAAARSASDLTSPKSSSLTPEGVSITFDGFTSRWTNPARCEAARARAICRPTSSACCGQWPARQARREGFALEELHDEVTCAIFDAGIVDAQMFGWLSVDNARISRPNRASN